MSNKDGVIRNLRALYARIQAAPDLEAIRKIAIEEIGNDEALEGEELEHARPIMVDYVCELCFGYGIPVGLVMPVDQS